MNTLDQLTRIKANPLVFVMSNPSCRHVTRGGEHCVRGAQFDDNTKCCLHRTRRTKERKQCSATGCTVMVMVEHGLCAAHSSTQRGQQFRARQKSKQAATPLIIMANPDIVQSRPVATFIIPADFGGDEPV